MSDTLIKIQVLYEIAISIGTSLDMRAMLQKSLATYLRKFSCAAGAVLQGKTANDNVILETIFSIPRAFEKHDVFKAALEQIPKNIAVADVEGHLRQLPYTGSYAGYYYHIMSLPGFGLLLLIKHGSPLEPFLIKSLAPLNAKLATACLSCLRKERIETIANDLKMENRQRQKAEKALSASHAQLENILEGLPAIVYVADLYNHEILFANRYASEIYGNNLVGRPCYEVVQGESQQCQKCRSSSLLDEQGLPLAPTAWEEFNPKVSRWFMHHSRAIPWRDGRMVRLQISTEISRLKQLEKERMEAAQREQVRRLESLGTLAGGIAHEYNNLLMGMMGCVSLMRFNFSESHSIHLNLNRIENNIRMAAELTDKLLGYAQKGRYENYPFQVNEIICDLVKSLTKTHPDIQFELRLEARLNQIEADRNQITHVLLNLLTNACDAMPEGGPVVIQTANRSKADLKQRYDDLLAESYIQIRIADSGRGMTEAAQDRIFEPFYTTKSVGHGAGLGMAATYGIVKGHKGYIHVASKLDAGSTLTVYLPAKTPDLDAAENHQAAPGPVGKKILLVDDETGALEIDEQMLTHLGHHVITAQNGQEAVALFKQHVKIIDLIILDVAVPGNKDAQILNQLKAIDSKVKIVVSSGFSVGDQDRTILIEGADDLLSKPFSIEALQKKLNKVFSY